MWKQCENAKHLILLPNDTKNPKLPNRNLTTKWHLELLNLTCVAVKEFKLSLPPLISEPTYYIRSSRFAGC